MSLTYITSATNYAFGRLTSYSFGSLSIGAEDSNRWVIAVVSYSDSFANGRILTCTLNGSGMSRITGTFDEPEGVAIYAAKVTTGTSATFAITENGGHRSRGIAIYRLISTEASPVFGSAEAENGTAASVGSVPTGNGVVAVQASTAYSTGPSIGGEATVDVSVNIDGSDYIRAYHSDNTTSATQSITSGSGASNHAIAVFSYGAGGPTTHEVNIADSVGISDAFSVSSIFGASLAESVGIADQQSASVTYEVTVTESAALNDAESVQAVFEVTLTESAAISDTNSVTAIYEVTISPGIGVGDVESYETGNVGTIGEAVGASVTFSAQCIYEVNAAESVSINDLQQVAAVFELALDNGVSITDLEQVQAILNVAVAEGITVNDIIQAALQGAVYYGDRRRISLADGKIRIVLKDKPHKIII